MKKLALSIICLVPLISCRTVHEESGSWEVLSPDGNLKAVIALDSVKAPAYTVFCQGDPVILSSRLGMALTGEAYSFDSNLLFVESSGKKVHDEFTAASGKRKHCINEAHERIIVFRNPSGNLLELIIRVSNHGVAFRYKLHNPAMATVASETSEFHLPGKSLAWIQQYRHMGNDYEMEYTKRLVDTMDMDAYYLPGLFELPQKVWVFISDADVKGDYAASQLFHKGGGTLAVGLPDQAYDWEEGSQHPWFEIVYAESTDILAPACLLTPWRAMIISDNLADIVESNLIEHLSEPSRIPDRSWIEPGVAVFPWWGHSLANDDPSIMKDYIDLAAEMDWEYLEFDIGLIGNDGGYAAGYWRDIDYIPEVVNYAASRGIKVYGWDERRFLDTREERDDIFSQYREWGIAGIKMDFVNSDKQEAMKWYEEATSHAAEYNLLVSFHGAITPRGLRRTYPNIMTYEGVRGAEYYKWPDNDPTPEHNCSLPFTRNVSGPMDYTPVSFSTPRRTTTYAHEMALPFVFESGWICMADTPEEFRRSPARGLFQNLHAAWDEIRFIDGYPGEYCCLARKKGNDWFVAAINAGTARRIRVPFSFLDRGTYDAKIYTGDGRDGILARDLDISRDSMEVFPVEKNGGFVIHVKARGE